MSPLTLRRYRADRLLRAEFERMRGSVIGGVSRRLRAVGVGLDASDLDACYAQAWQGLYAAILDGTQIDSPEGWLARVTYRRAIDEHRSRRRIKRVAPGREHRQHTTPTGAWNGASHEALAGVAPGEQCDLAERLDDRERLRQVFEALRCRLSTRERQAATLCYLHGLTRAEAAARMGVSERRMQKLMDGRGGGDLGVAQKVGALVEAIAAGRWCDEQGSLMRGLAYGLLDPAGERYRLADAHRAACPACRAYVLSLRGLAAVLPPVPSLLHLLLAPGAAAGGGAVPAGTSAASGSISAGAGAGAAGAANAGGSGATAIAGSTASSGSVLGALSASGGAGGGWWLAGGVGAKLAAGCLLALGVGAGCVALGGGAASVQHHARQRHATRRRTVDPSSRAASAAQTLAASASAPAVSSAAASAAPNSASTASGGSSARKAAREFGPEQSIASGGQSLSTTAARPLARAASVPPPSAPPPAVTSSEAGGGQSAGVPAAQREFAPG